MYFFNDQTFETGFQKGPLKLCHFWAHTPHTPPTLLPQGVSKRPLKMTPEIKKICQKDKPAGPQNWCVPHEIQHPAANLFETYFWLPAELLPQTIVDYSWTFTKANLHGKDPEITSKITSFWHILSNSIAWSGHCLNVPAWRDFGLTFDDLSATLQGSSLEGNLVAANSKHAVLLSWPHNLNAVGQ